MRTRLPVHHRPDRPGDGLAGAVWIVGVGLWRTLRGDPEKLAPTEHAAA